MAVEMPALVRAFFRSGNYWYLPVLALAVVFDVTEQWLALAAMLPVSTLYNSYDQKRYHWLDVMAASLLIGVNIYLFQQARFAAPYFPIAVALLPVALLFWFHSSCRLWALVLWHATSAGICLCALLSTVSAITNE